MPFLSKSISSTGDSASISKLFGKAKEEFKIALSMKTLFLQKCVPALYLYSFEIQMLKDSGKMEERDYRTYIELFSNMANFMRKPNLIVYLEVSPEQSLERIKMR